MHSRANIVPRSVGSRLRAPIRNWRTPRSHSRVTPRLARVTGTARSFRSHSLVVDNKLVLKPIGDGTTDHIGGGRAPSVQEFELRPGFFELGREESADFVVPVPTVSGRHAVLRITESGVMVTDLESTNGTYIDREELQPMRATELKIGSQIIFGDEHLANFVLSDEAVDDIVLVDPEQTEE